MKAFIKHTGRVVTMDRSNVDTDQIIPKQFLKRIERTGFGKYLFYHWRFADDETPNPDFELNHPRFKGVSILVARKNFGNGSSREHAVWALDDYGFRCIIAESFADIFYNNCSKNGVLPVVLTQHEVEEIHRLVREKGSCQLTVDLEQLTVTDGDGFSAAFELDDFRRQCFLEGLDQIALTLQHTEKILAFEEKQGMPKEIVEAIRVREICMTADEILQKIRNDGVINRELVAALETLVKADWIVERNEVELLFQANNAIGENDGQCPEWARFFVSTVTRLVVADMETPGTIDTDEGDWLGTVFEANSVDNETEKKLMFEIQNTTTSIHGKISELMKPFQS